MGAGSCSGRRSIDPPAGIHRGPAWRAWLPLVPPAAPSTHATAHREHCTCGLLLAGTLSSPLISCHSDLPAHGPVDRWPAGTIAPIFVYPSPLLLPSLFARSFF